MSGNHPNCLKSNQTWWRDDGFFSNLPWLKMQRVRKFTISRVQQELKCSVAFCPLQLLHFWLASLSRRIIIFKKRYQKEDLIDHYSYTHNLCSWELKPEKKSVGVLNRIRTHDLCDTSAVLYPLSYQANWELATYLWFIIYW